MSNTPSPVVAFTNLTVGHQTTEFVYGVATSNAEGGSRLYSNDLLREVRSPNVVSGDASWWDSGTSGFQPFEGTKESYAYDGLGEQTRHTDRVGTSHLYTYDAMGRVTGDTAATPVTVSGTVHYTGDLPSGVDGAVRRLTYTYDPAGRLASATSWDDLTSTASGHVVNQDLREYTGYGQLSREYQAVLGQVDTGSTPYVGYRYVSPAYHYGFDIEDPDQAIVGALPATVTYPNGRVVVYSYDAYLDQQTGRPTAIGDPLEGGVEGPTEAFAGVDNDASSAYLEQYTYLGLGTVVQQLRPQTGGGLTYESTDGSTSASTGDVYVGLDAFSRVTVQNWVDDNGTTMDGYAYTYDRDGNPTSKANLTNPSLNEVYTYDNLNRLTGVQRGGTISGTGSTVTMTGTVSYSQTYAMDALGNIVGQTTTQSGTVTVEQRGYDRQNELTATTTLVNGTVTSTGTLAYDLDGNQTSDGSNTYTYDAWNHLAKATVPGNTTVTYTSDAMGRKITETSTTGTSTPTGTATYYNDNWQDIEERAIAGTVVASGATVQNVWSTTYVDALVERDRDADDDSGTGGNNARDVTGTYIGGLEERLYATHDANFNTTGLVHPGTLTGTGAIIERYSYTPYGTPMYYDGSWSVLATQTSSYGNDLLFQEFRADTITGLSYARHRWYGADQERWTQQDPAGWPDGLNAYSSMKMSPLYYSDLDGLEAGSSGPTTRAPTRGSPGPTTRPANGGPYGGDPATRPNNSDQNGPVGPPVIIKVTTRPNETGLPRNPFKSPPDGEPTYIKVTIAAVTIPGPKYTPVPRRLKISDQSAGLDVSLYRDGTEIDSKTKQPLATALIVVKIGKKIKLGQFTIEPADGGDFPLTIWVSSTK